MPVGTTVRPDAEHTFQFTIMARSSGEFFFSATMVRPGRLPLGDPTPRVRIVAAAGEQTCDQLRQEREQQEAALQELQELLRRASPGQKAAIRAQIATTRAAIAAIARRLVALGCE